MSFAVPWQGFSEDPKECRRIRRKVEGPQGVSRGPQEMLPKNSYDAWILMMLRLIELRKQIPASGSRKPFPIKFEDVRKKLKSVREPDLWKLKRKRCWKKLMKEPKESMLR